MIRPLAIALILASALVLPAAAQVLDVSGEVRWDDALAVPRGALVEVALVDVGRGGGEGLRLATIALGTEIRPAPFRLSYDAALVPPGGAYRLVAELRSGGRLVARAAEVFAPTQPGGSVTLRLREVETAGLVMFDTKLLWAATGVFGQPVLPHTRVSLVIGPDGTVSGSTGCNRVTGTARLAGEALEFDALATTRRACSSAEMTQERRVLRALRQVRAWRASGPRLELLDASGLAVMELRNDL